MILFMTITFTLTGLALGALTRERKRTAVECAVFYSLAGATAILGGMGILVGLQELAR